MSFPPRPARPRWTDDAGATAVEYGLFIALIAAIILGALAAVGTETLTNLTQGANALP